MEALGWCYLNLSSPHLPFFLVYSPKETKHFPFFKKNPRNKTTPSLFSVALLSLLLNPKVPTFLPLSRTWPTENASILLPLPFFSLPQKRDQVANLYHMLQMAFYSHKREISSGHLGCSCMEQCMGNNGLGEARGAANTSWDAGEGSWFVQFSRLVSKLVSMHGSRELGTSKVKHLCVIYER